MKQAQPSPDYYRALDMTKRHHKRSKTFSGRFLFRYADDIKKLIDDFDCKSMLDYGCGKGEQYVRPMDDGRLLEAFFGIPITKFDPGVPRFAAEPKGKFDIVICTQVLGSIPVSDLGWGVDRLYGFANKVVYVGERLGKVKKDLHAEINVPMPHEWTREQWAEVVRRADASIAGFLRTKDTRFTDDRRHKLVQLQ